MRSANSAGVTLPAEENWKSYTIRAKRYPNAMPALPDHALYTSGYVWRSGNVQAYISVGSGLEGISGIGRQTIL